MVIKTIGDLICICEKCKAENILEDLDLAKNKIDSWVDGFNCTKRYGPKFQECFGTLIVKSIRNHKTVEAVF